mmetsp:Transcript_137151/g.273623  ORF Transcript_137151/g.273623 Transcript_137151/m.273623 type:complete len:203 (-) Transcript_137151:345-953(-)|eukprot:CAMPEP_0172710228 /NCGR_PEP_ID=MMETSP1074-20121228/55533_1 /TAXON_ID=2916 /ORGANISM="Ceratium fusus, Strain PA161109" /LENGTH=202 /DNA_ID=CAMNT_0013533593 /DNA_START=28 /DNA_END=636 /DNA_ORIENTATION=+
MASITKTLQITTKYAYSNCRRQGTVQMGLETSPRCFCNILQILGHTVSLAMPSQRFPRMIGPCCSDALTSVSAPDSAMKPATSSWAAKSEAGIISKAYSTFAPAAESAIKIGELLNNAITESGVECQCMEREVPAPGATMICTGSMSNQDFHTCTVLHPTCHLKRRPTTLIAACINVSPQIQKHEKCTVLTLLDSQKQRRMA